MAVTPDDIADELGRPAPNPTSVQYRQWQGWINAVEMLIQLRCNELGVSFGSLDPALVDFVVVQLVAARAGGLPGDGASSVEASVDDARIVRRFDQVQTGPGFDISDYLWGLLGLVGSRGAFTISPSYTPGVSCL